MKSFTMLLAVLASLCLWANPIKTIDHGSWDDPSVWENNVIPDVNDEVEIRHRIELYETNANSVNGVLTHNGLIYISYHTTSSNNGFGNEDGQLTIHTGATLKVTAGLPNQDAYLVYSANNDTPHVDHSLIGYNSGDLIDSIPAAFQPNFLASSSIIVQLKVGGVGYHQRGHLNINPGGALETSGDLNIFGRANVYHGGKVKVGDDLNMIGDWSRLTVFQINCGDFIVGDDVFIDCLGRIDHQSFGTKVFVGQDPVNGTPETYPYLFTNPSTPQSVLNDLSFEMLIHYQDFIYHTPNPGNKPIEFLLDIDGNNGVIYTSGNPENLCNNQPDLSILKEEFSNQGELTQGGEWSYKITVKNNTYYSLTSVKILESEISNNFEIISIEPIGTYPLIWEQSNTNGVIENYINIPFIYPFGTRKFKVTVKHDQNSCEPMINQVDIVDHSLFSLETNSNNNTSQISTPLSEVDHLSLTGEILSVDQVEKSVDLRLKLTNLGEFQNQVVVADFIQVDSASTIESITSLTPGADVSINNNYIEWTVSDFQFQDMVTLDIRVDLVELNAYQEVKHTFQITEPSTLCNPLVSQGEVVIPFGTQEVDLAIQKTVKPGFENVSLGEQVEYLITVTNLSSTAASNVNIVDIVDPDLVTSGFFSNPSLGNIVNGVWEIPVLPGNSFATIEFTSQTIANSCHNSVINIVEIAGLDQIDIDSSNNSDQVYSTVSGQIEIAPQYEILSYNNALRKVQVKFSIPNNTTVDFTSLKALIDIPSEVDAMTSSISIGSFVNDEWNIPNLASGATAELVLDFMVQSTSTIGQYDVDFDLIELTPDDCDTNNNAFTIVFNTVPPEVDLKIIKTVNISQMNVGGDYIYFLEVKNESTTTAALNTIVEDVVDSQVTVTNVLPIDGSYSLGANNNHIIWSIPQILPGESALMQIKVTPQAPSGSSCQYDLPNTAEIISTDLPNISSSNSSSVLSQVSSQEGITLEIEFDPNTDINQVTRTVDFTVKAIADTQSYNNVDIQLSIPNDFLATPLSLSASTGSYNGSSKKWIIGDLAAGATEELSLSLKLDPASTLTSFTIGALANVLTTPINCLGSNPKINGVFDPANLDLKIVKSVEILDGPFASFDEEVVYTITLTNTGTNVASNIIVNEDYDLNFIGIDDSSVTASHGTYTAGVWSGFDLMPNTSATLTVPAKITSYACDAIVENIVTISQALPGNPSDSATATFDLLNEQNIQVDIVDVVKNQTDFTAVVKLEVTNDSSVSMTGVEIENTLLSNGLNFVDSSDQTMVIASMAAGEVVSLEYEVKQNMLIPNFSHNIQVEFIKADQPECDGDRNSANFEFTFDPPPFVDIEVKKVASVSEASFGDEIVYTIEVKNLGNTVANDVLIQDLLVPYLTLNSVSDITVSSGTMDTLITGNQEQINWIIPSVEPYDGTDSTVQTMEVKVTVSTAECEIPIYNQAKFNDLNDIDLNVLNDQDGVIVNGTNDNDLVISSTYEDPFVENNQQKVKVIVSVSNNSAITFSNVLVENIVNQDSFDFEDLSQGLLTIADLPAGETVTFEIILVKVVNGPSNQVSFNSKIISSEQEQCNDAEDSVNLEIDFDLDCLCAPWDFVISPNPVSSGNPVTLQFESEELSSLINYASFDLKMYNSAGQLVLTRDGFNLTPDGQYQLGQTNFSSGHYIIKIEIYNVTGKNIKSDLVHSQKLIII